MVLRLYPRCAGKTGYYKRIMKNTVTVPFLFSTLLLAGCHTEYVKNKLRIQSFSITDYDIRENTLKIKFDVLYYSDSTFQNGFSSMEKGQNGSEEEIVYFGLNNTNAVTTPYRCAHPDLDSFRNGFNHNYREFSGQRFDFEQQLCIPPFKRDEKELLLLVLYNRQTGKTDTLSAQLPQ